ncbi:MAG: class I SAM-dependent methyltransferase [Thermoanaerobaculia bacterium]
MPDLLRLGRTAALRLATPIDRIALYLAGKSGLPPLWLRRHAGAASRFESSARQMAAFLDGLGVLEETDDVLDVGCGAGAMAGELARRLGPGRRYVGFDVHAPSIGWCRKRFAADPSLSFEVAPVPSPYGSRSGEPATSYRLPMEDGRAGFILAKSVFTHLLEPEARHYLAEIRRTLKPGRGAIVTAFLFDATAPELDRVRRAFPFGDSAGCVRWRRRLRPEAAVAYERLFFFSLVEGAGLRVQWVSPGYFPGRQRLTGQDILLLGL